MDKYQFFTLIITLVVIFIFVSTQIKKIIFQLELLNTQLDEVLERQHIIINQIYKPEFPKDRSNTTSTNKYEIPKRDTNTYPLEKVEQHRIKNMKENFIEMRDVCTGQLTGKEVSFRTVIDAVFSNKYKGIINNPYVKKETLIFETEQDAENYFVLENKSMGR